MSRAPSIPTPAASNEPRSEPCRVAVIGGGYLGMRLAEGLAEQGHSVTLVESASHLGGMADSWTLGIEAQSETGPTRQVEWDRHYHVLLESDLATRELLQRLDLEDAIRWGATRTGFYTDGRHVSMSNSLEFLRFPPLSLVDKIRLAITILYCSRVEHGRRLESIRVLDFLQRWSGRRTTERVWRPLLRSKLGDDLDDVSAAFIWSTIRRMYAARRSGLKTERFGYVEGGYKTVNDAYHRHLEASGVTVELGQAVHAVLADTANTGQLQIELERGERRTFDQVVVTQAPALTARLCPDLAPAELRRLRQVTYRGVLCASLLLRRPLRGYYVTNITDSGPPFTGVIETTALVPTTELSGYSLVYLPRYLAPDDPAFDLPDAEILDQFISGLLSMYPELEATDVVTSRLSRVRRVTAVPTLDYSSHVPEMRTSIRGLFTVNSSQILNGTLNVNETLQLADRALHEIATEGSTATATRERPISASVAGHG